MIIKGVSVIAAMVLSLLNWQVVHAQDLKVGYVNVVKIIEQAPQGDAALKKLESEFGPRDRELRAMRDQIKGLEEDLDKNALVLKESERRSKERELLDLQRSLKRSTQEFREDYNLRRNEELNELQKIVYKAIVDIAKTDEFDLIIHEGAVFASDRIDITEQVLKQLSK